MPRCDVSSAKPDAPASTVTAVAPVALCDKIVAAWDEWRDAERDLDGKFQQLERARERQQRALANLRQLSLGVER